MEFFQPSPIKAWHTNSKVSGKKLGLPDLPVTLYEMEGKIVRTSTYKIPFLKRLSFLFDGIIHVTIWSDAHPPIGLGIGNLFANVTKKKTL